MTSLRFLLVLIGCLVASEAFAHPHVWVTARSELVYGPEGRMTAVRHAWTFDDMFSSFATQGLDADGDGKLTREELAPLAEVNVTSLAEFKFFTFGKFGDKRVVFDTPVDYWLESGPQGALTLHFTLPVKDNAPAKGEPFRVEVYDPTYFVAFEFAKEDPARIVSAPAGCGVELERPKAPDAEQSKKLSESFFSGLSPGANFGAQFSNTLLVACR
ncbi:DUF1007 family protein [Hansschlegelia beijingensis]|uniref:ABC-type uncharacterized transport system substrate-binding protein n=1 Tax=Hansschlegelia beijingensis TaxID=1133344 RepID=A0A7W6D5J8_9HYPH|nr:DUF1007 family protein [Hansschlegelia beijingensis]MBB3972599.1 ABC-type uncharacterized transport system substrate-binding protein [Hansschlegelia beijingensis]